MKWLKDWVDAACEGSTPKEMWVDAVSLVLIILTAITVGVVIMAAI